MVFAALYASTISQKRRFAIFITYCQNGLQVMETKESVSTELDPDAIPVEDVVQALNEETGTDDIKPEGEL